jgi:hypothetical protein
MDKKTGRQVCSGPPPTTGKKLRHCKGGPSPDDSYGLVKFTGIERLETAENPYGISIEDVLIR